jgi:hypothetical protein
MIHADAPAAVVAQHAHTNALIHETSPYLLQHAHNPVDWRPWGPEAFEAARRAEKPIFLSIGYSTCYWCHVMERESFENEAIARLMNEHFICIKVDREERPDVDDIYMAAVQIYSQLTTGHPQGGWPMSVFLEPESLAPFHAGTYYPPEPKFGRSSFPQLLTAVADAWQNRRGPLLAQGERLASLVREHLDAASPPVTIGPDQVNLAVNRLIAMHDAEHGGFGDAPKFPQPVFLELLIGAAWDRPEARAAVIHTLRRMAMGGVCDQVGGGFHRYSVDERWLVPHFEKMLYDQGQLVSVYAAAFERTGEPLFAEIVRETLDFVLREMLDESGAFTSALDAEVNAREGGSYLWSPGEVREALVAAGRAGDAEFALRLYGLDQGPNFRDPHHPGAPPANVLYRPGPAEALAREFGHSPAEFAARRRAVNDALLAARALRDQPATDDKVLAGWNGLMIAGLADGGRAVNEPKYIAAAARASRFILERMRDDRGGLLRSWRGGEARIPAFLEDYALLLRGLLALRRATGDETWLRASIDLAERAKERFWAGSADGPAHGEGNTSGAGYFDTLAGQSDLFVRTRGRHDGAMPSGNSVMLLNLIELNEATGEARYLDDAAAVMAGLSSAIAENPLGPALATLALQRFCERWPLRLPRAPQGDGAGAVAVHIEVDVESVEITPAAPATVDITVRVPGGYHINAHDPGMEHLVGLAVELVGDARLRAQVVYPPGEPLRTPQGEWRVHTGALVLPVTIEIEESAAAPDAGASAPMLLLTCQPCTEAMCLKPMVMPVPVRITVR